MNTKLKKLLLTFFLITFFCCSVFSLGHFNTSVLNNQRAKTTSVQVIANNIKDMVGDMSSDEILELMKKQYVKIHFLDNSGNWKSDEIEQISYKLLPKTITIIDVFNFIDQIAMNLEANPYLVSFLNEAVNRDFYKLSEKLADEGSKIIKDVVTWAMVLENITKAHLEDPVFLNFTTNFWIQERKDAGVTISDTGLPAYIKMKSVEIPVKKGINALLSGKLDPKLWNGWLPFNIFEAVFADQMLGHGDNAAAGWPLMRNAPGEIENLELGTGPARFTPDRKSIEARMALPQKWADLYQVWNMAFLSQINNHPYWMVKLLIPQVSGYQENPEEYIYRRAISLYTTEQYIFLGGKIDKKNGVEGIEWADKDLTSTWGKFNRISGKEYQSEVNKVRK